MDNLPTSIRLAVLVVALAFMAVCLSIAYSLIP